MFRAGSEELQAVAPRLVKRDGLLLAVVIARTQGGIGLVQLALQGFTFAGLHQAGRNEDVLRGILQVHDGSMIEGGLCAKPCGGPRWWLRR